MSIKFVLKCNCSGRHIFLPGQGRTRSIGRPSDVKTRAKAYPQGTLLISKLNACFCPCFPAVLDCYYYNIKRQRCKNILSPKIVRIRLSNIAIYERWSHTRSAKVFAIRALTVKKGHGLRFCLYAWSHALHFTRSIMLICSLPAQLILRSLLRRWSPCRKVPFCSAQRQPALSRT